MKPMSVTNRDRKLAAACGLCPVCRRARRRQRGVAYWLVKTVERGLCPFCMAYEKVHGRKSFEPAPPADTHLP